MQFVSRRTARLLPAALAVLAASGDAAAAAACSGFYPAGFTLSSARTAVAIAPLAKPAKGVALKEPAYGTCVVRATDHLADGVSGFARNDYSRRQAFNADNSQYLIYSLNGFWHTYDANTLGYRKVLPGLAGDAEPQWHPTNPDLLYYLPTNGVGMRLHALTVSSGAVRTVADFSSRLKARWPGANAAWTKSEGSPSKDGRYWCFMVDDAAWRSLGVFTWDRDTDTILGTLNTNGERPDHVSMSPSGSHCVVSGDGARGTVAYSRDFSQQRKLHIKSEHSDLAVDANGDDVYVAVDYNSNSGDVFMVNLRTGVRTDLFPTYVNGSTTALHVSGKAFAKPGYALISTYATTGTRQWLHNKLFAVALTANPAIYNLGHHRVVDNGYFSEPVASVNRDFTRILFNSNWGVNTASDIDTYLIEVPAGSLAGGTGTPTTPTPTPPISSALTVKLTSATRSGYSANYALATNQPARCRAAWSPGHPYGTLYDTLTSSTDGLRHTKALTLGAASAQTVYAVCKAVNGTAEQQIAVQLK